MAKPRTSKRSTRPLGAASPTNPRNIEATVRHVQAMDLRRAGASYPAIAESLGYNDGAAAHKAVVAGIEKFGQEPAADVIALELDRLDRLWLAIWERAIVKGGDLEAIGMCLQITRRREIWLGISKKVEMQHSGEVTVDHGHDNISAAILGDPVACELACQLLERAAARTPNTSGPGDAGQQLRVAPGTTPEPPKPKAS